MANKLSLQKTKSNNNRNKLLKAGFLEIVGSESQFPGDMPALPLCGRP